MGEEKKSGKTGALRARKFFIQKKSPVTVCIIGLYSHNDKKNYKNQQKQLIIRRKKMGRNQEGERKAKLQTDSKNSV